MVSTDTTSEGGTALEGTYQLHGGEQELLELFVAAPGPAGWRYFGRVFTVGSERELSTVDFVVDTEWRLVRYRERHAAGPEIVVVPAFEGVEVARRDDGGDRSVEIPRVDVVWSRSPCSLLVAERRARALRTNTLSAVRINVAGEPSRVAISLDRLGSASITDAYGERERIQVRENGRTIEAVIGDDRPFSAEGWFDLLTPGYT